MNLITSTAFWKSEAAVGVVATLLVIVVAVSTQMIRRMDLAMYDMAMRMTSVQPSDKIAIIAIDKNSIDGMGRWPWPREVQAEMIDRLAGAKPAAIGMNLFYTEPQVDPGLSYINRLIDLYNAAEGLPLDSVDIGPEVIAEQPGWLGSVGPILRQANQRLNMDRRLAASIHAAGNVVLPIVWGDGQRGGAGRVLPNFVLHTQLPVAKGAGFGIPEARGLAVSVLEEIGASAAAVGHQAQWRDFDGTMREETIVMDVYDQVFPSFSLAIAARAMSLAPTDIKVQGGDRITVGKLVLPTNSETRLHTLFYAPVRAGKPIFPEDSWADVMSGKVQVSKYQDKIVLIGTTAPGVANMEMTPVDPQMSEIQVLAHKVSNLLRGHAVAHPGWGQVVTLLLFTLAVAYLILLLPHMKFRPAIAATAGLLLLLVVGHVILMTQLFVWIELMLPAALLFVGHMALLGRRFVALDGRIDKPVKSPAISDRTLGLALQAQGQLDLAFEKLLRCPPDEVVMESLYRLGLAFESKRMHGKAEQVFRHMALFNPKFRDLEERMMRFKLHQDSTIPGISLRGFVPKTPTAEESAAPEKPPEKPTPGKPAPDRYQIEKTLDTGDMGAVYLARDTKTNRMVALKTLALSREFEERDLAEVKARFFREAETAGRLNHPHIVTIYDAGEEHDLAYIAMEFLKGRNLTANIKMGALMEMNRVVSIVTRVAEALAYAHRNNVVHRDIKPANIMYDVDTDQVKLTDFGIARITDSIRTRSGKILGTPSYMSPEQLAGVRLDGRSDLFSLGVMLHQLLSGVLPFAGETMSELMQKIANEPHVDVRTYNSAVPEALAVIVDKALNKDLGLRYQTADEMAHDLRHLASTKTDSVDFLL